MWVAFSDGKPHTAFPKMRFLENAQPANLAFSRATTDGGTKGVTSPPMDAICLTSVAVIGRTAGEAGQPSPSSPASRPDPRPDLNDPAFAVP